MHTTLCKDVKGYIDSNKFKGWCYHIEKGVLPLRVKFKDTIIEVTVLDRTDLASFFKNPNIKMCGWEVVTNIQESVLEMNIDNIWTPIFNLVNKLFEEYKVPTFLVVDNFYKNPDDIRKFAMKQNFEESPKYHKGKRSINPEFRFPGLKERFERILGAKIKNWDHYGTNGCFQYCIAGDQAVYHCDGQQYAGVLFLTPDAPPQSGTRFYRSKHTKKMTVNDNERAKVFNSGYYDSTQFDEVDVVGNVYNRIVLFNAKLIHAAPIYFGTNVENGRLFQLFFFDLDN